MAHYGDARGRDIEEPCPCDTVVGNVDQPVSPTSAAVENPDRIKGVVYLHADDDFPASCILQIRLQILFGIISRFFKRVLKFVLWPLVCILAVPFLVVYIFITGDTTVLKLASLSKVCDSHQKDPYRPMGFDHMNKKRTTFINVEIQSLYMATAIRLGCLVLIWLFLNLTIPNLKRVTFLGSLLWTWSLLAALILIGYPILFLIYTTFVLLNISKWGSERFHESDIEYYMEGLSKSIMLVIYFTSILATWVLCIDTKNPHLHRYGMLTLVSVLVGAILNVVKSIMLLLWKTKLIYDKYEPKILSAGCLLYFHLLIMGQRPIGSTHLVCWCNWENYKLPRSFRGSARSSQKSKRREGKDDNGRENWRKNLLIEDYMLDKRVALKHVDNVATNLTKNFELNLVECYSILDVFAVLQQKFSSDDDRLDFNILTTVRNKSSMDETDSQLLLELLQTETSKETPSYEDFEKWMVDGLKYYHLVGLKLKGANERMNNLNRVLTGSIVVLVILVWLFITGLATTNVVVALASLFLGISFVFADACKAFFLGLTFTFVIYPYDVGDRCVINDMELLVKKVNILSTVFENQHKNTVIFPNLDLSTKNIVKLEESADPEEDLIELHLHSSTTTSQIRDLEEHIDKCLKGGIDDEVFRSSYDVMVEEDGQNVKMNIHFKHHLVDGDVSVKMKRRSRLFLKIRQFMDDIALANKGS